MSTNKRATKTKRRCSPQEVLDLLERKGTKAVRDGMARFGIAAEPAFGMTMGALRQIEKSIGRDHALAAALWKSGWYEARMLATLIDDPEQVTAAQMERWCRAFDNWAIVDTACFALFDRTPHAWNKIEQWSKRGAEFQKRAAFALLWSTSVHDKAAPHPAFVRGLELIEREATDDRHFVKKAVNMALRAVGKRNAELNKHSVDVAQRLAASKDATARWIGKDALRELKSASVQRRLTKTKARTKTKAA